MTSEKAGELAQKILMVTSGIVVFGDEDHPDYVAERAAIYAYADEVVKAQKVAYSTALSIAKRDWLSGLLLREMVIHARAEAR